MGNEEHQWTNFDPPQKIELTHPWLSRYYASAVLHNTSGPTLISTTDREVYGNESHPIAFRIGNGGAGYTGLLRALCEAFIRQHSNEFRIGWVVNHSRHTQIALLGDVVQVGLTYEPVAEEVGVEEGWCRRVCAPAFMDHFILVGPMSNPACITSGDCAVVALRKIAERGALFHTRGDGSATHEKEQKLWKDAGIETDSQEWLQLHVAVPYEALQIAARDGAYLLTDRSTFLTAKKDRLIQDLVVYTEGEPILLNPCSALVNTKVPPSSKQKLAIRFAEWLGDSYAQALIRTYGKDWPHQMLLFTDSKTEEFPLEQRLVGKTSYNM